MAWMKKLALSVAVALMVVSVTLSAAVPVQAAGLSLPSSPHFSLQTAWVNLKQKAAAEEKAAQKPAQPETKSCTCPTSAVCASEPAPAR